MRQSQARQSAERLAGMSVEFGTMSPPSGKLIHDSLDGALGGLD